MGTPASPSTTGSNEMIPLFLSSILSQRGPSSLPYTEDSKWLIRRHLLALNAAYPSLEPRSSPFTHNDGRTLNLLQADGTIPMPFQGVTYNIPVIIWLLEPYPRHPPLVFLNPTRDMIIKRQHPHVTPSGLVSTPYLLNWIYPSSNLVDLVAELSSLFARDPPLYSQRRIPTPNPTPPQPPPPNPNPNPNPSYSSATPYHPPPARTEDAAEVFRRNAVSKIADMVHGDVVEMRKAREVEMEGLLSAQHLLRKREEVIQRGLSEMQDEMTGLESQLQLMLMNTDVLSEWIRNNQGKAMTGEGEGFDVDTAFECTDSLSKQMLECAAADLAIEDTVYSLDKAVQEGAVPFDLYLRNVRLLSREQFFHRATATKVRAVQLQAQVATMASRVASFASS